MINTRNNRPLTIHPAWLLVPLGLAVCILLGLIQGRFQSPMFAAALVALGLAVLWVATVAIKPEWALLIYTVLAVNLNSVNLPIPFVGTRLSPDIILMVLLMLGTVLRVLTSRTSIDHDRRAGLPITLPYLVFLAVPIMTLLWTPTFVESVRGIFRFVGYYALMWLIVDVIHSREQVKRMVAAIMISVAIPIATGFYQAITGGGQLIWAGALFNRIYGLAGGPFTLAFYLVMLMPLLLIFFLAERRSDAAAAEGEVEAKAKAADEGKSWRFSRVLLALALLAALSAVILTFIRGAWIALVVSLMVLGIVQGSLRFRQLVLIIPAGIGIVMLTFTPVLERIEQAVDPSSTLFGRLEIWKLALQWILLNPLNLLAGLGMKAFEYHYILLAGPNSPGLYWRREQFLVGNRPHNEVLGFVMDVGVVGTIAFIVVLITLVRIGIRVYRQSTDEMLRLVALAFLVGGLGLFVGAMGDNVFSQPSVAVYFWIMAGLVMAIDRHLVSPEPDEPARTPVS